MTERLTLSRFPRMAGTALSCQIASVSTHSLPPPGSLAVIKEVFSHHVFRLHLLDRSLLLLDGLVGTPGKTLRRTDIRLAFPLVARWLVSVFAF